MTASAGRLPLLRQPKVALSLNLSDSREATRSQYYYFGLGSLAEHAVTLANAASGRR